MNNDTMTQPTDRLEQLEAMLDQSSLPHLVHQLCNLCEGKAAHLEENWQDKASAKEWRKAAVMLDGLEAKLERLGIPKYRPEAPKANECWCGNEEHNP